MVLNDELINKVRHLFGLNLYETKIWLALLAKGTATAGELSEIANVPRSRTYDILESLEKKGFVIVKIEKPIKYVAIPPREIINKLKRKYSEDLKKKLEFLEKLKDSELIKELEEIHKSKFESKKLEEHTGAIKGRSNILSHIETMFKDAEKYINIITTELFFIQKVDALRDLIIDLSKKGIKITVITPISELNLKYIKDLLPYVEIYDAEDLRGRVITIDGKEILLMLYEDTEVHHINDVGLWIYSPFVAKAIDSLIEKVKPSLKKAEERIKDIEKNIT